MKAKLNTTVTRLLSLALLLLLMVPAVLAQEESTATEAGPAGLDMLLLLVGIGALAITGFIFFSRNQVDDSQN
jgi:uncharacterized membrane protein SirB2